MSSVKPLSGQRIGIIGKGGAGKSTITVLAARALQRQGYSVCVLDADSTNVGLHGGLGLDHAPAPLLEYFGGTVFSGGRVSCPVDDPTRLPDATISLQDFPGRFVGRSPDGIWFLVAGKLGALGPGAGCDGPIAKIARDLEVRSEAGDMVTLVDLKAGFEDSARGLITGVDWVVVVVDPTRSAVQLAADMSNLVRSLHEGGLPATEHLENPELVEIANSIYRDSRARMAVTVLNRVPDDYMEQKLRNELIAYGIEPVAVVHESPAISASWLSGGAVRDEAAERDLDPLVAVLEAVAAAGIETETAAPAV